MIVLILMNLHTDGSTLKILFAVFSIAALRMLPAIRTVVSRWMQIKFNQYAIDIISENINHENDCGKGRR